MIHVSAQGGFRFITGDSSVTYISAGSTGWSTTSTRSAETSIPPVDSQAVLDGVTDMEASTWEHTAEDGSGQGVRHIGPMAEEFHEAFDLGDTGLNSINADGVAFAAIQGLSQKRDERPNSSPM